MVAALVFFFANTLPVAVVIALTEGKSAAKSGRNATSGRSLTTWSEPRRWVWLASSIKQAGWQTSLLVLPLIYWVYRSYHLYLGKLEAEKEQVEIEKRHAEEVASLNMRTIEALALAIEAKDHTTHKHLQRVRVFAVEVAKELSYPRRKSKRCARPRCCTTSANWRFPNTSSTSPGA